MPEAEVQTQQDAAAEPGIAREIRARFPNAAFTIQQTRDDITTVWTEKEDIVPVLRFLKSEAARPYAQLYDLTAIDERIRTHREGQPESDFTVVYHLISYERNEDVRLKVALNEDKPSLPSAVDVFPNANWYEREAWDMFGVVFDGHPNLRRILMPNTWKGHPLRKDHPARATEMPPFSLSDAQEEEEQKAMQFRPEDWGMKRQTEDADLIFLNLGPQHPGTHGVLRVVLQLDGERVVDAVPDIGYHHRGAEKMGERQSWHSYIPYTDRVEYLGGVMNNLPYVLAVEKLAGIEVPDRVKVIRVMMCELFRIMSHLVWWGTFAGDVGALSPVFYMFSDRERAFGIVESVCGGRMHPSWFRIGGVAHDLPDGWEPMMRDFVALLPPHLKEWDDLVMKNPIFKARTQGIGAYTLRDAMDWGVTGPGLRACGFEWDWRKNRPYSGYERFDFEIPTATNGDCYDRAVIRVEEIRQSLRIIQQCIDNMPSGSYKSDHPLATPPRKDRTMHDIETLITHFVNVAWGPVIPPGEAAVGVEATKGNNTYYLISDGNTMSYRTRIRTPTFPHMQMVPLMSRGALIPDVMAILGSIDYVLSDVDR